MTKLRTMITPKRPDSKNDELHEKYNNLAKKIFNKKALHNWYEVSANGYNMDGSDFGDMSYYVNLKDDEVSLLRGLLKGYDDDGIFLYDMKEDIPFFEKLVMDHPIFTCEPRHIDVDHPVHFYGFSAVIMKSIDGEPEKTRFPLLLSDSEYIALLKWRLVNRDSSFNMLVKWDPRMYCWLTERIISVLGDSGLGIEEYSPFLVFMDEVDKDVMDEVGEKEFSKEVFYESIGNRVREMWLHIEEKKLTFRYEDTDDLLHGTHRYIYGANALSVQKVLGATCYKEVYDIMKEHYGKNLSGFDLFKQFLDDHSIAYEYSEDIV